MCTDMPARPNTTQPLRIVIDPPALAAADELLIALAPRLVVQLR
ncbi:Uncharacterised protein [Achromobacter xylosoxidans]|nr:Uncharacterised protein [Achromobacter xylosoxidans]